MEHEHHEHAEHVHKVHVQKKRHLLRNKPWMVSTFVLLILVVLLLLGNVFHIFGNCAVTGKSVSAEKAGENLLSFALNQGLDAEVSSVEEEGSFYLVTLLIDGSGVPVYVTKDGKYFTSSLVPLEEEENTGTDTNTQTQDVPKTTRPTVDLFVMSHCPYGTQAEKGIIPVLELLGDKIDFNLRFVYYSMHPSSGEVEEELNQYCIQKEQEDKLIPYLKCFLQAGEGESCLTEAKIDKTKLNLCVSKTDKEFQISENKNDQTKWLSGSYPLFNIDKDLNEMYDIGGSPTLVINGVQVNSGRSPAAYLDSICQTFADGSVPEECGEELSASSYSAGFGYATTSSETTAQC